MSVFGIFIAIFIGIGLVSKEVERRSIYSLLAKPVRRSQLITGKYAGLVLTLAMNVAVMTARLTPSSRTTRWTATETIRARRGRRPALDPRMLEGDRA